MHKFVSFKNQICLAQDANLSALSSIALYGRGIFTTIAIYNSKPFLWEKHWLRLTQNAEKIGVDLSEFSDESIKNSLAQIISQNVVVNGRARLTFFAENPGKIWSFPSKNRTSLLITTADFREISKIKLTISAFRVNSISPLVNVKSCNYLESLLAFEDAKRRGFDEAVRLNEKGEIVSGCMANIFWVKGKEIFTPSLETGCLGGITRNFILEKLSVQEVRANLKDLENAQGIFLTSAGIGITEVEMFGKLSYKYSESFVQVKNMFNKFVLENQ